MESGLQEGLRFNISALTLCLKLIDTAFIFKALCQYEQRRMTLTTILFTLVFMAVSEWAQRAATIRLKALLSLLVHALDTPHTNFYKKKKIKSVFLTAEL